jgi:HEAT repeat protein
MQTTKDALDLPLIERLDSLRDQGTSGYHNLVSIMFNESEAMEVRWRAVTAIGRIAREASMPDLVKSLHSPDWFMRNAGLISIAQIDQTQGVTWARRLLNDKALVVRSAAVDTLAKLNDKTSLQLLWNRLYAKENYRGDQSLFIRRQIVETLARLESTGREQQFIKILGDKDESLHAPAIAGLERITKQHLGDPHESLQAKRAEWQQWWKSKSAKM